ncbi:hypothetical protein INR49_023681 [Caranx melampygus]|nr:hypothetical protein INR49_023681 [Caranx melampygus]
MDSDVSLEIPSDTVIAYSILELEIKKNGDYDICLQSGAKGGFESDSLSIDSMCVVDGKFNGENPVLQNGSEEMDLSPLAELDQATRRALFKTLQETMRDRATLSYLQCELEKLCRGDSLDMAKQEMFGLDRRSEGRQFAGAAKLNATHLLVSAMEELPDETLSLLSESPADFLEAFNTLMCRLKESSGHLSIQQLPVPLQDNQTFQQAEQLLSSTSVILKRDTDRLWMETGDEAGALPLVLCLSARGLSLLCSGLNGVDI